MPENRTSKGFQSFVKATKKIIQGGFMNLGLKNKVAVITGSALGVGKAIAKNLGAD